MIEKMIKKNFFKQVKHEPLRIRLMSSKSIPSLPPSPPMAAPRVATRLGSSSRDSSSFIKNALKKIFNVCTHNTVKIKEHKDKANLRLRKLEARQKEINAHLKIEPP